MRGASGRTRLSAAVFTLAAVATFAGCDRPVPKNVAATVDGRPIGFGELDRALAAQFSNSSMKVSADQTTALRLEALQALIDNEILLHRAEKEGMLASDGDVDAKFNEYKTPYTQ